MLLRLAAGLLAAATAGYAAHNITVINNATSVAYSGGADTWKPFTNCGGSKYTYVTGQFFNFNFVGTGVYVVGTASTEGGIVTFNLDGVTSTYDRYSPPPYRCGVLFFGKGQLDNTAHTLTATFTGPSPENSTASPFFEFQYIQYTQVDLSDSLTTSTPVSTSGTTSSGTATSAPTQPASSKVNAGAIGGGIAAGVIGLLIIGFVIWFCVRREKQEKAAAAAAAATRPSLDPPRQSFMYSPVGAVGYGRLSHDGEPGERRRSMSTVPGGATTTSTPWTPDAHMAASLAPQSDSPATHYPPGAAAPSVVHSSSQSSGSSPVRSYPQSSASGYTVQNPGSGTQTSMMGTSSLPESEVERIAARVASMMNQPPQLPPGARPPKGGAPPPMHQAIQEAYDQPPPMYEPREGP